MKRKVENKVLFTIDGFEVRDDSNYLIADRKDGDAPTGFVEAGVSKLPSDGVDETFGVRFVKTAGKKGVWDTGFYEYSPCYAEEGLGEGARKESVKALIDNVLKPYRLATGEEKAFESNDNEFFDGMLFKAKSGKVFNTADPVQRMELYFSLRSRQVAPKGREGDAKYREASYVLHDTAKKVQQKDEVSLLFFEAVGTFVKIFENNPEKLRAILIWFGFKFADGVDKGTLVRMFKEYVENSYDRLQAFLNLVDDANTDIGYEKVNIYKKLKEIVNKSAKIRKMGNGVYSYDGEEIGPDLKSAAENIAKNKNLLRIKNEILLVEE